jgi:hypothetical protein
MRVFVLGAGASLHAGYPLALQSEHIAQIQAEMAVGGPASVLDLEELMSVDLAVVQFLCRCEAGGVEIVHGSPYVIWMRQERKAQPDRTE